MTITLKRSVIGIAIIAIVVSVSTLATSGSGGVIWRGDYETGNFSQWECGLQVQAEGRATVVTSPVRQGKYAARYEVRPGDHNVGTGNGERTEVKSCRHAVEGEEQWWAWSTMFAPDFSASNSDWNIFTQFHNSGTTGGRVEFYVNGNSMQFVTHGGELNNPTARFCEIAKRTNGKWYDFVIHVKWSSANTGFAEVWVNGKKAVQFTNTPTLYVGQDVYLKQGYYREPQSNVGVIFHDGMRQGTSYADVAAEFPGGSTSEAAPKASWGAGACLPKLPRNVHAPVIEGVVRPGRMLKASRGSWSPAPTRFRYQWQASDNGSAWRNLRGATGQSLLLPATFSASTVRVRVTGLNAVGSSTVVSAPVGKSLVVNPAPKPVGSASIVQSIRAGQTLRGTVVWKAVPASPVRQIVFAMDGNKVTQVDASPPYEYVLDTTKLANGEHTLGLTVTRPDGTIVWRPYQIGTVTIDNNKG